MGSDQPLVDEATCLQQSEHHIDPSFASSGLLAASSEVPTVENGAGFISNFSLSLPEPRWRRTCSVGRRSTVCHNELSSIAARTPALQTVQACEDYLTEP